MNRFILIVFLNIALGCVFVNARQWNNSAGNYTSGNLGIGISNTAAVQLEVAGSGTAIFRNALYNYPTGYGYIEGAVNIFRHNANASSVNTVLNLGNYWNNLSQNTSILAIDFRSGDGGGVYGGSIPTGRIKVQTAWVSPFMDFDLAGGTVMHLQDGSVGIGTTHLDAKLAVNGTIHSKEVRVDLNFPAPDYVFEPTYTLPSLDSVQSYINQNKHLPEVPSAKEMETNGVNLGEMNMLLLKKVEELTLYVIEQQKQIKELKEKVNKK